MSTIFFYIIIHPIAAFIGWLLCGLVKQDYARIALRAGVLAVAFTPTVVTTDSTEVPVSAISAILFDRIAEPRPDTMIVFVWITVFMIGIVMHLAKKKTPTD
jgi:hypothetical protein